MLDIWVCSNCHSINRQRAPKCYKCGAPQQTAATGEGEGMRLERAIQARIVSTYRSAAPLALVASFLLLGMALMQVLLGQAFGRSLAAMTDLFTRIGASEPIDLAAIEDAASIGDELLLPNAIVFIAALVAFAGWLALSVANIPALGGGQLSTGPWRVFVSALIPGPSFLSVPRHVQNVLYRVDRRGGGVLIVAVAWVGLIGGWLLDRVAAAYFVTRVETSAFNATSVQAFAAEAVEILKLAGYVNLATTAMIGLGAVALVVTIIRVELRAAARDREVEQALGPG